MNISIIGAGPAGNYLAYLLKKSNKEINVNIYETKKQIGLPIQCTGILTNSINQIIKLPKEVIAAKITKLKLISPDNNSIQFNFKEPNLIIHRDKFDKYFAKLAEKEGVNYHLQTRYLNNTKNALKIKNNKNHNIETRHFDILIGADGPNSGVAKHNNLFKKRQFAIGQQILTKLSTNKFPENEIQVFLGVGEFAWIVPEGNNLFRIGLVSKLNSKELFNKFIKRIQAENKIKITAMQNQSGPIPIFNPKQQTINQEKNIFLLGDSATQVKATSYGGIIHGLLAAEAINNYLTKHKSISKYNQEIKQKVIKELYLSLQLRKVLNKFTEKNYNSLIKLLQKEKARIILEQFDRDFPSKFLVKMFLAQPKLAKFVTKLI